MVLGTVLWDLDFDLGIKAIEEPSFITEYIDKNVPEKYDPHLKQLLKKMLHPDPMHRITIEHIMKKKYIKNWANKIRQEQARKVK